MSEWTMLMILMLPLIGGVVSFFLNVKWIPSVSVGVSFVLALILTLTSDDAIIKSWEWMPGMLVSVHIDKVTLILVSLVTLISLLVHVFSFKYMEGEDGFFRYYAKLGLFVFSMIGLLIVDHLILLFVFWELVGVSSYLLIGFWYSKENIPKSARMAFMVNRVTDACLLAGILLLFDQTGELSFLKMNETAAFMPSLLIAIGAFGKSAQFPFSGWLTKAMVGPTPVSALIHAATMVAAGVYLLFRFSPYIHQDVLIIIAVVGTITAFYGGICALNQFDIKKVLAYSTISQLGYMILGIGVGARDASLFHLITHAFFKAGLFLAAASIIHYLHQTSDKDAQDMRFMGGLRTRLPWTFRSFLICGLSLAGVPLFSGFLSKDAIIVAAWGWANELGTWAYLVPDLTLLTALLTAFYVGRTVLLVFYGDSRIKIRSISLNESNTFAVPLLILAVLSFWVFFNPNPIGHSHWLMSYWGGSEIVTSSFIINLALALSIVLVGAGLSLSYALFKPGASYTTVFHSMGEPKSFGGKLIFEGVYLTKMYELVGKSSFVLASFIKRIDASLIDPLLNAIAISSVVFSKVLGLVDRFIVDGPVNKIASFSSFIGRRLAGLSSRDLQTQLLWLMFFVILILGLIMLF